MRTRKDPYVTGIYRIRNLVNGKCYIGKSVDIYHRFKEHREGRRSSAILQRAFNKYGLENFSFEIIEECNKEDLCSREDYWIESTGSRINGYNIAAGGQGGDTITSLPKERYDSYISKLSKPRRDGFSEEQSARFSGENNPMYGNHTSDYQKKVVSERVSGTHWINNGISQTFAKGDKLREYLDNGWSLGMLNKSN